MEKIKLIVLVLFLNGCVANYGYRNSITTIVYHDGTTVTQYECTLKLISTREVDAGKVGVNKNCSAKGGADHLGTSKELLNFMSALAKAMK